MGEEDAADSQIRIWVERFGEREMLLIRRLILERGILGRRNAADSQIDFGGGRDAADSQIELPQIRRLGFGWRDLGRGRCR